MGGRGGGSLLKKHKETGVVEDRRYLSFKTPAVRVGRVRRLYLVGGTVRLVSTSGKADESVQDKDGVQREDKLVGSYRHGNMFIS